MLKLLEEENLGTDGKEISEEEMPKNGREMNSQTESVY